MLIFFTLEREGRREVDLELLVPGKGTEDYRDRRLFSNAVSIKPNKRAFPVHIATGIEREDLETNTSPGLSTV